MKSKRKAIFALGILIFFCIASLLFVLAANEQSILSGGSPVPHRTTLADLIARGPGTNKHLELTDFYFGKPYIYTSKLVEFQEVYVPLFPAGAPENAANLRLLLWIRNDRNSNERLILSEDDLDQFIADLNRNPRSVTGVLRQPIAKVRELTAQAYPGTDTQSLQILWDRRFPDQQSADLFWVLCGLCFLASGLCVFAYKRMGNRPTDAEMELRLTRAEAASGKQFQISVPQRQGVITVNVPPGVQDGARLRFPGMGRPGKSGKSTADFYIRLRVG